MRTPRMVRVDPSQNRVMGCASCGLHNKRPRLSAAASRLTDTTTCASSQLNLPWLGFVSVSSYTNLFPLSVMSRKHDEGAFPPGFVAACSPAPVHVLTFALSIKHCAVSCDPHALAACANRSQPD